MSDPFAPPGPQPPRQPPAAAYPAHPQAGPVATYPQPVYGAPAPAWTPQPLTPAPKQSNGLAVAAIIVSGVALLAVLAMAAFLFLMGPVAGGGGWVLEGQVTVVDKGVVDSALEEALVSAIEDDGGDVDQVRCPPRSQVAQGLVTVCRGSVDGFDWTGVVVFEDDDGAFIVTEY